jgi:hypothetical protein
MASPRRRKLATVCSVGGESEEGRRPRGRAEAVVAIGHRRRELAQGGTKRKSGEASSARDECLSELLTTKKRKVEGSALANGEEAPAKRMTRLP